MYICVLYCTCLFPPHSTANLFIVNLMELKFLFLPNIVSKLSVLLLHKRLWEAKVGWTAFLYLIVDTWMGEWEAWNEGHSKVMLDWLFNLDSSACAPQRPATWTRPSPSTQPSASAPTTSRSTRRTGRHQNIRLHLEHHRLEHSTLCLPDDVALTGFLSEDTRSYAVTLHSKLHLILWFGSMDFVRVQWEDGCTSFNLSPLWLHSRSVLSTAWVLMSAVLMGALNRPAELPAIPAQLTMMALWWLDSGVGSPRGNSRSWNVIFWWAVQKDRLTTAEIKLWLDFWVHVDVKLTAVVEIISCRLIFGKGNFCIIFPGMLSAYFFWIRPELVVKKLRYYARYIVVCLLLNKMDLVKVLVKVRMFNHFSDVTVELVEAVHLYVFVWDHFSLKAKKYDRKEKVLFILNATASWLTSLSSLSASQM